MFEVKKIVVPTDLSKISTSAFDYAASIAKQYNAEIHLINVLEKSAPFLAYRSLDVSEEKVMNSMEERAKNLLSEISKKLEDQYDQKIISVLRKGIDYEVIINYAKEISADLIIIATHGRTGILHTLLGSVAEKVIRYSKIPVLVTTPAQKDL